MASSMTSAPMVANFREPVVPHLLRLRRIDRETMHGGDLEISFGQIRIMSSRPVLGFPAKKLLVVLPERRADKCHFSRRMSTGCVVAAVRYNLLRQLGPIGRDKTSPAWSTSPRV